MAGTTTKLITAAEYEQIPDPPAGRYELYHRKLVKVSFSKSPQRAQWQLRRSLERAVGDAGVVDKEIPYRPLPEHECWGAGVAFVSQAWWDGFDGYLMDAPELVVEVLSPSSTAAEMLGKRNICPDNGARESWAVDTNHHQVEVSTDAIFGSTES